MTEPAKPASTILRTPFAGNLGYGIPPDAAAADAFLERLQADPIGIVERFITMCRTREPGESLSPPHSELWELADQLMDALMHVIPKVGRETWDIIVDSGLVDLYQDLIVADGFFQEPVLWIDRIIGGLTAILMRGGPDKHVAANKTLARTTELFKAIWENRQHVKVWTRQDHMYVEDQKYTEPVTCLVWHYNALYRAFYKHPAGPETFIPQVGLHCWVFLGGREDLLSDSGLEPMHFLDPKDGVPQTRERDEFVERYVVGEGGIGLDTLILHLRHELERESVPAEEYQQIIGAILSFSDCPLVMPSFFKHCMDVPLVEMVGRVASGKEAYLERARVWQAAFKLHRDLTIYDIKEVQAHGTTLRLRSEGIVNIIARGLDLRVEGMSPKMSLPPENVDYMEMVIDQLKAYTSIVEKFEKHVEYGWNYGPAFIPGMRAGARVDWWPTLRRLQAAAYRQGPGTRNRIIDSLVRSWIKLGTALGFTIESERRRHEREARHRCSWIICDNHKVDVPPSELRVCAGCAETRYCSRACQKSDWTRGGHKQICKRLK